MLYRSTDRLCRPGAPVQNLAHSASLHSCEKNAPSNAGIKHLSGSSGKLCGIGQEGDAGLAPWAMTPPLSPAEGMAVRVPVGSSLRDGLGDLVPGLEAAPGQGEGAQDLPPWLDEVEGGGVFRLEHHLPAWVRQHEEQDISGAVAAQIIGDGVDALNVLRQPTLDVLQEGHPVGGITPWVGSREGGARRRAEGTEDVTLAAPPVVDLLPGTARRWRVWPYHISARIALGAERAHLVEADD